MPYRQGGGMLDQVLVSQILMGVIAFFLVRLIKQVDESSKSVRDLSNAVGKLNITVEHVQEQRQIESKQFQEMLREHHEEIEMLRERTHDLGNDMTFVLLEGQVKNGWNVSNRPIRKLAAVRNRKEES